MNKVSLNKIRKMQLGGNTWQQVGNQQVQNAFGGYYNGRNAYTEPVLSRTYYPSALPVINTGNIPQGSLNGNPFKVRLNDQVQQNIKDYQQSTVDAMVNKQHKAQTWNQFVNTAGTVSNILNQITPQSYLGKYAYLAQGLDNAANTAAAAFPAAAPYIEAAQGLERISRILGLATDNMTVQDTVLDKVPGLGALNAAFGKRSHNLDINKETEETVGSDYGDTYQDIYKAKEKANKKYGLFSTGARHNANRFIDRMNNYQDVMTGISDNAQRVLAQSTDANIMRYNLGQDGGIKQQYLRVARIGAKLPKVKDKIEWQPVITIDDPIKLEKGGDITIQIAVVKEKPKQEEVKQEEPKNVIPDGALHAHKHHMDNTDSLTQKGIPVVDDKGEQQAEIEKDEIILHLKLTNKLEELQEKYEKASKTEQDKLAIEAGKLLVEEILHNTIDNTNLIDKCKEGGKINGSI